MNEWPPTAERARTVLTHACPVVVDIGGDVTEAVDVLGVDADGSLVFQVDTHGPLGVRVGRLLLHDDAVDLAAYAGARPDPLAAGSDQFVEHLVSGHASEVLQLAHLFTPAVVRGMRALAPIRVDRFGLTFRIDSHDRSTRARLNFPSAVRDAGELAGAMQELQRRAARVTTCPFN